MRSYDTALVTGASRGLGAALAREMAARGYRLMLVARTQGELSRLADELRQAHGATVHIRATDLCDAAALQACAEEAQQALGAVDVLVNNAGTGHYKPLAEWTPAEVSACTALNLTAPMLLAHALVPGMVARGRGMVVNVASDLARRYLANMAPYVAAKFGLLGFSGSLLREVKQHGVKVMAVLPGIIDTAFGGDAATFQPGQRDPRGALDSVLLARQIADLLELPNSMVMDEVVIHPLHQQDY